MNRIIQIPFTTQDGIIYNDAEVIRESKKSMTVVSNTGMLITLRKGISEYREKQ